MSNTVTIDNNVIKATFASPVIDVQANSNDRIVMKVGIATGFGITGATYLDQLNDVDAPTPANGEALVFNTSTGKWEPTAVSVGTHTHTKADITDFNDSDYATAAQGALAQSALQSLPTHTHTESQITDLDKYTQAQVDALISGREPTFSKATAFNKAFGTTSGTVAEGNDPRFTDARVPTAHSHTEADITDLDKYTTAQVDALLTGKVGTSDSRLTDARTPLAHTHTESQITDLDKYTQSEVDGFLAGKVDTSDSRLTDARTPLAHTHTKAQITDFNEADYATPAQLATQTARIDSNDTDIASLVTGQAAQDTAIAGKVSLTGNETIAGDKTLTGTTTTLTGDLSVQGNVTFQGDLITKSSNEVNIGDSIVTLNSDETGTPTSNAGIEIERGTATNAQLLWDEASDTWKAGISGSLDNVVVETTLNAGLAGKANTSHTHTKAEITDFSDSDYATAAQGALASSALQSVALDDVSDVDVSAATTGQVLTKTATGWEAQTNSSGVTDHGALSGLGDDDHTQYHNNARGDARYYLKAQVDAAISPVQSEAGQALTLANDNATDISNLSSTVAGKEDSFTKQSGFNKPFGTVTGTVVEGNDSRLSDARTPTAHTHTESDITDLDKYSQSQVDSLINGREAAFSKNTGFNKAFGSTADTVVEGNDARLSDARTPVAHTHTLSEITDFTAAAFATSAQGLKADSALQSVSLDTNTDVNTAGKTDGQVLAWNQGNSEWEAVDQTGGTAFNGGTVTENIEIDKADANSIIDASTGTPRVTMNRAGVKTFEIQGLQTRALLRRYHETGGGQNRFEMYDDSSRFDHEVRGVSTTVSSNSLSLVTKDYVDSNINGAFNGGTITENLSIEKDNAKIDIKSTGSTNPTFNLWYNGTAVQQMYYIPGAALADHIRWVKTSGPNATPENTMRMYSDRLFMQSHIEVGNASNDPTTKQVRFKEALGNGNNHVAVQAPDALAADYTIIWPTTIGAANQSLKVGSINGSVMTMVWG